MPTGFKTRPRSWSPQMQKWMGDSVRHGKQIDFIVGGGSAYRDRQTDIGTPYIVEDGSLDYVVENSSDIYVAITPFPQGTRITDSGNHRIVTYKPLPIG